MNILLISDSANITNPLIQLFYNHEWEVIVEHDFEDGLLALENSQYVDKFIDVVIVYCPRCEFTNIFIEQVELLYSIPVIGMVEKGEELEYSFIKTIVLPYHSKELPDIILNVQNEYYKNISQ